MDGTAAKSFAPDEDQESAPRPDAPRPHHRSHLRPRQPDSGGFPGRFTGALRSGLPAAVVRAVVAAGGRFAVVSGARAAAPGARAPVTRPRVAVAGAQEDFTRAGRGDDGGSRPVVASGL